MDTRFAFNDEEFLPNERTLERLDLAHDRAEEEAADKKAIELLYKSPYKEKLGTARFFLETVQARAPQLKNLIGIHLGNSPLIADANRLPSVTRSSPPYDSKRVDQIAALPLGRRVKVDSWNDQLELARAKPMAPFAERGEMPFDIIAAPPYLTRLSSDQYHTGPVTGPNEPPPLPR